MHRALNEFFGKVPKLKTTAVKLKPVQDITRNCVFDKLPTLPLTAFKSAEEYIRVHLIIDYQMAHFLDYKPLLNTSHTQGQNFLKNPPWKERSDLFKWGKKINKPAYYGTHKVF